MLPSRLSSSNRNSDRPRRFITSTTGLVLSFLVGLPLLYLVGRFILVAVVRPYISAPLAEIGTAMALPDNLVENLSGPVAWLLAASYGLPALWRLAAVFTGIGSGRLPRHYVLYVIGSTLFLQSAPHAIRGLRGIDESGAPASLRQVDPFDTPWFKNGGVKPAIYVSQESDGTLRFWNRNQLYTEDSHRPIQPVNGDIRRAWEMLSPEEKANTRPTRWFDRRERRSQPPVPIASPTPRSEPRPAPTPRSEPRPAPTPRFEPRPTPTPRSEPSPIPYETPRLAAPATPVQEYEPPENLEGDLGVTEIQRESLETSISPSRRRQQVMLEARREREFIREWNAQRAPARVAPVRQRKVYRERHFARPTVVVRRMQQPREIRIRVWSSSRPSQRQKSEVIYKKRRVRCD